MHGLYGPTVCFEHIEVGRVLVVLSTDNSTIITQSILERD
jgi:hypothetical protein